MQFAREMNKKFKKDKYHYWVAVGTALQVLSVCYTLHVCPLFDMYG